MQGVADFAEHDTNFGGVGLGRRFPQIQVKRCDQRRLVYLNRVVQLLQLLATKIERMRGAGLKELALARNCRGYIHNQLGESSSFAYKVVKHASLAANLDVAPHAAGGGG